MALLEYLNHTVPDVIPKSVQSFYYDDPLMKALVANGKVVRSGGSQVRFTRIKSGHSDITQIDASNISVSLSKRETFGTLTGDWGRYMKPVVIAHIDLDRMESKEQKKRYVQETVNAVVVSFRNAHCRRIYVGDTPTVSGRNAVPMIGTLNGGTNADANTNGQANGFGNGAMMFATPAQQATAGTTYLNQARLRDATNDEDNWHNQYVANTGIGTDFLDAAEEIKMRADSYSDGQGSVSLGILGHAEHVALGQEIRSVSQTSGVGLVYTPADLEAGRGHKVVHVAGGVRYYSNRWMTATTLANYAANTTPSTFAGACYFLNPMTIEYWINAGHDFRVTKFTNHLEHGNQAANIAYVILESQFVVRELLCNGCTKV